MESFRRGYSFFKQAWQMAFADRDLLKPTIYAFFTGFIVTVIGIVPIVIASLFFGDGRFGNTITYILGTILFFVQITVSYIFSAMTIHLIYGYLSDGDGRMDHAWAIVRRDFLDILSLAAASTAVKVLESLLRGRGRRRGSNFLANLLNTVWTEATYLVLPAMVIEDIGLGDGLKRATQIIKDNLLLVGISTIGVGFVTGLIGTFLGITGVALGLAAGFGLAAVIPGQVLSIVVSITVGSLIALTMILLAVIIGSYTNTAYHTCLYLWARDVERALDAGQTPEEITAPGPLASILSA